MGIILVFYSFSHTHRTSNVALSFIESWADPISVVIVVVVQVAVVAVHIPHVVSVVRRPQPNQKLNWRSRNSSGPTEYYPIFI